MRVLLYIIQKEFRQVFRNRTMLPLIFVIPFVQLIILVNAATMDMKRIDFTVVDMDMSGTSRKLTEKFSNSPFFRLVETSFSVQEAEASMVRNETDMILVMPRQFEQKLTKEGKSELQLQIDAINGMTAGLIHAYSNQIILGFNREIIAGQGGLVSTAMLPGSIDVSYLYWYNTELEFKYYMVPGILVILLTLISMFLTTLNLVREKEMGTIEQINVTPIRKYQFIIGKLVPFWVIALCELAFGLALGKVLFNIPIEGSLLLLFGFAAVYLVAVLGIGLLISTFSQTQQQAMFLNFFIMITFILMSGIFTPAESMPQWAQKVNILNPFSYFMRVIRMILLKGSGFGHIMKDFIGMCLFGVAMISLATWRFRKTS